MQTSPIQLGELELQDFEVPQSIRFGGRYRVIVRSLAGGQRIIERLGPDDSEIRFAGTFSGPDAENRARAFDNLRLSGQVVWLTWESFKRLIIVKSFVADYHSPWWIPYSVSCLVVRQQQTTASFLTSVVGQLSSDLGQALLASVASGVDLAGVQNAVSSPNHLTTLSSDQTRAVATIASTLTDVNNMVTRRSVALATSLQMSGPPSAWGAQFASGVNVAGSLAAAVNVRSYVGRMGVNIAATGQ